MNLVKEVKLKTLAMDSLQDYINSLVEKFIDKPDDDKLITVCRNLREMLIASVPPSLVNEVTCKLLKALDARLHFELMSNELIQEFVNAVIHPGVTELNFGPGPFHESLPQCDWNFIIILVVRALENLDKLKYFRISCRVAVMWDVFNLHDIKLPSSLQEFTSMYYSDDTLIETIAQTCHNLRYLNISNSRNVSDDSISSILKLKYLQELNVQGTSITENGVTELLNGIIETNVTGYGHSWSCASQLLSFGCSNATSGHVHTLVKSFPNLVSVILSCQRACSLEELKKMENLRMLSLSYVEFRQIENLLMSVGSHLQCLDICDVGPINVRTIGETCSSLKCLHISSSETSSIPSAEDFHHPLEGFQSVECVILQLYFNPDMVEYILCQCQNLRKLDVTLEIGNASNILHSVLKHNSLKHVEEFNWWGTLETFTRDTARRIVQHCPQLRTLRSMFTWFTNGDTRELENICSCFHGL